MNELNLTSLIAYEVWVNDSDGRTSSLKGYCTDYDIAVIEASKDGWVWTDRKVVKVVLYTDGKKFYKVNEINREFLDDSKSQEETLKEIKNKLTPEELNLLSKHLLEEPFTEND